MSLSPAQLYRRVRLGKNKQTLLDAGVIDETGVHTQEGRNLMWAVLFDQFEDELVEAVQVQNDAKDSKKSSKKSSE